MPIVDGRYEMKLSTIFATAEEGIMEIKKKTRKSRRIRLSSLPIKLLEELKPDLQDKDLKVILPMGTKPDAELKKLGEVATSKAKIYVEYMGREANTGSVMFSDIIFNVIWTDGEILSISTMEYGKCVKCMGGTFDAAWRYSQKW